MIEEYGTTFASLGLNLSSALASIRQQVGNPAAASDDQNNHLALLTATLCRGQQADMLHHSGIAQAASALHQAHSDSSNQRPLTRLLYDHLYEPTQRVDNFLDYYFSDFWHNNGDPRSSKLPFMSGGPWKLIYATLIYLYLIKRFLPQAMRHRKPFELQWCIRGYNLLMVLSNLYAFYHGSRILLFGTRCFGCEIFDSSDRSDEKMELLHYGWLFLMSRVIEWLDTVFFVLRKKDRQVSKLHVFHHSFVPLFCWIYLKFLPGYTVAFFPYVNSFVHTIMYTYYFLATFGPKVQPYLWWKRHLTSMQIIQFVLILVQLASIPMSTSEHCKYPQGFLVVAFAGAILFLWLFYTYYTDTYNKNGATANKKVAPNGRGGANGSHTSGPNKQREGSSRSLSDCIENALGNEQQVDTASRPVRRLVVGT